MNSASLTEISAPAVIAREEPLAYRLRGPFHSDSGNRWIAHLPAEFMVDADVDSSPRSQWQLLEDGRELGPGHMLHSEIAERGGGRFSHWQEVLYFSASDNSNPNENNRRYDLRWAGSGKRPWLSGVVKPPLDKSFQFGPSAEVAGCAGLVAICGASFSGSTLVNTVLGAHPQIFGGGELHWLLTATDASDTICAVCKQDCRFWTETTRASIRLEELYHQVSRMFGRAFLVDASKESGWFARSLTHLVGVPIIRVLLVKHPVRHVASHLEKKGLDRETPRDAQLAAAERVLFELRQCYEEFAVPGGSAFEAEFNHNEPGSSITVDCVLRYEDFVASPERSLGPVLGGLGLAYDPRMALWAQTEHHHIGGNVGPLVQIHDSLPERKTSQKKYRQRGIFLDDAYLELLDPDTIAHILGDPNARWICERFGYGPP